MATRFRTVQGGIRQSNNEPYFDYSLLFTVLFLIAFGLMMIYSSSSYKANLDYDDSAYFLKKQLVAALFGIAGMVVVSRVPYHVWEGFAVYCVGGFDRACKDAAGNYFPWRHKMDQDYGIFPAAGGGGKAGDDHFSGMPCM